MKNLFLILSLLVSAQSFAAYDTYCGGTHYRLWVNQHEPSGRIEYWRKGGLFGKKLIFTDSANLTGQWFAVDQETESTEHAQLEGRNLYSYYVVFDLRQAHIYVGGAHKASLRCRPY